jgi:Ca-activated chloride channel homolog
MLTRKWATLWSVALILLLAIAVNRRTLRGQSGAGTPAPETPVIDKLWPDVNLNVVALDKQGVPQKVDEQGFQLFEDGSVRPLQFRGSPDSPVSIAFMADSSGSMYNRRDSIATIVRAIVKTLPEGSEVMFVSFSDQAYVDLPFTPVSKVDLSFLDHRITRGGTSLYDAVIATENYFTNRARYVRRAIVLMSDGGDDASRQTLEDAMRSLQYPGAPSFYSLSVNGEKDSYIDIRHGHAAMQLLAKAGGGVAFRPKEKDFMASAARLAKMIRCQYVLHFKPADPARDGSAHKLEVRLPIQDVQIHALPVYYAPSR